MICTTKHASPCIRVIKLLLKFTAVAWVVELHQQVAKVCCKRTVALTNVSVWRSNIVTCENQ